MIRMLTVPSGLFSWFDRGVQKLSKFAHAIHNYIHVRLLIQIPAYLNVVDIAGLVKGANEGQGLGNAFLSHISGCDAIFHMLRELSLQITHPRKLVFVAPRAYKLLMMSHCKTTKGYSKTTISLMLKEKSIQSEIFKSLMMNLDSKIWLLSKNQWQKWKNVSTPKNSGNQFSADF